MMTKQTGAATKAEPQEGGEAQVMGMGPDDKLRE